MSSHRAAKTIRTTRTSPANIVIEFCACRFFMLLFWPMFVWFVCLCLLSISRLQLNKHTHTRLREASERPARAIRHSQLRRTASRTEVAVAILPHKNVQHPRTQAGPGPYNNRLKPVRESARTVARRYHQKKAVLLRITLLLLLSTRRVVCATQSALC